MTQMSPGGGGLYGQLNGHSIGGLAQPLGKQSLLSSILFSDKEGLASYTAHIMEADGSLRFEDNARLTELVRDLWPGENPEGYCNTLRLLSDWTKKDFLLKPQRKGIVARSDIVRAFIEPTRAVIIGVEGNATFVAFLQELQNLIIDRSGEERSFETSVVESIVCANVTVQIMRFQLLQPVARNALDNIRLDESELGLMQLFPVRAAISSFIEQMKPIVYGLNTLLQSSTEPDAPLGRIRAASSRPSSRGGSFIGGLEPSVPGSFSSGSGGNRGLLSLSWGAPGTVLCTSDEEHPELEEILENWHNAAKEVLDEAQELTSNLDDATRFLDASLSCMRNRLLKLEYVVSVPTFAMTAGTMIAGMFGMNLDKRNAIWFTTEPGSRFYWGGGHALFFLGCFVIVCVIMIIWSVILFAFQRSRNFYKNHSTRFGNNKFFTNLADDEYILSLAGGYKQPHEATRAIARGDSAVFNNGAIRTAVMQDLQVPAANQELMRGSKTSGTSRGRSRGLGHHD